jgi:hypothetical protein
MWSIQQRLQALLAVCMDEEAKRWLAEAARVIEAWRQHYNRERPHNAPDCEPPERFARRLGAHEFAEGLRPLPTLAPDPRLCYDVNGSPSSWT